MRTSVANLAIAALVAGGVVCVGGCYDDGHPLGFPCDASEINGAETTADEGWQHVASEDDIHYEHNPPASGPHFTNWASWENHSDVVNRANWVHNLEHGGIVLLIGPDASDGEKQEMIDAYDAIPDDPECHHKRALVTADPLLDSVFHVAAVAALTVLQGDAVAEQIVEFTQVCRNHGREDICY